MGLQVPYLLGASSRVMDLMSQNQTKFGKHPIDRRHFVATLAIFPVA